MIDKTKVMVGDVYRIVDYRSCEPDGDDGDWNDEMEEFFGREATIVRRSFDNDDRWKIKEDSGVWWWYDYMLEEIEDMATIGESELDAFYG